LSFSSSPGFSPTTTSALHVRSASTLSPEPSPSGPMASVNGVVGSQATCTGGQSVSDPESSRVIRTGPHLHPQPVSDSSDPP
jgi:hypothetical protein